jgi:hypothetical protein
MSSVNDSYELSASHINLLDSNALISAGRPSNAKYSRFRRETLAAGATLLIPKRVEAEVRVDDIDASLDMAVDEGWIEIVEAPPLTHGDSTNASDIARRTIASMSPAKEEYNVEKADVVLAGLAVEYLKRDDMGNEVTVITADIPAQKGIVTAMSALGYDNRVHPVTLFDIVGEEKMTPPLYNLYIIIYQIQQYRSNV